MHIHVFAFALTVHLNANYLPWWARYILKIQVVLVHTVLVQCSGNWSWHLCFLIWIKPGRLKFDSKLLHHECLQLEIHHPSMYRAYFRKNDMEEPPPVDDGDEDKETPAHVIQSTEAEDESNLEARFYRYGVRPEWLQIYRILRHRLENCTSYLWSVVLTY